MRIETEAKLEIQQRIKNKKLELAWSYMLDFENQANPFAERREAIAGWRSVAVVDVEETTEVLSRGHEMAAGLRAKDALHIACALVAKCEYFLTTDDTIVTKMRGFTGIKTMNPTQFLIEVA